MNGVAYLWARKRPCVFPTNNGHGKLNGLTMEIYEVYLDDVIIFAPTEEILLERVR
jgi:hypothetical protein